MGATGAGGGSALAGFAVSRGSVEVLEDFSADGVASVCDSGIASFSGSNGVALGATRGLGAILGVGFGRLRADTNGNCVGWDASVSFILLLLAVARPLVLGGAE